MGVVGTSVLRKDGAAKVAGTARYVDDVTFPGMLHARTMRATIPSGRVKGVRLDFDQTGFTVADWRDIPAGGRNIIDLIVHDQPCLVESEVRHVAPESFAPVDSGRVIGERLGVRATPSIAVNGWLFPTPPTIRHIREYAERYPVRR